MTNIEYVSKLSYENVSKNAYWEMQFMIKFSKN